jgi:hypothetical protein
MLGAGRIAERAPGRHHLAARPSHARIRIMASKHSKFSGTGFVNV